MTSRRPTRKLTPTRRRQLEVAAAIAREAVKQHHVTSALRLIELGADRAQPTRMLDIYLRLHGLMGAHAEQLAYSVLAALGTRSADSKAAALLVGREDVEVEPTSMFQELRRRLRGRTHHELRRWVELATGAAQARLLDIHVAHATRFADELAASHSVAQACALYADMAGVPGNLRDLLQILLLDRLATRELPRSELTGSPSERVALYPRPAARTKRAM